MMMRLGRRRNHDDYVTIEAVDAEALRNFFFFLLFNFYLFYLIFFI
jgi:hypothetical protein